MPSHLKILQYEFLSFKKKSLTTHEDFLIVLNFGLFQFFIFFSHKRISADSLHYIHPHTRHLHHRLGLPHVTVIEFTLLPLTSSPPMFALIPISSYPLKGYCYRNYSFSFLRHSIFPFH